MGKTLLTPRHSLNAFFRSPSQLNVRTGRSQQKLTAHFAFNSIHKLKFDVFEVYVKFQSFLKMNQNGSARTLSPRRMHDKRAGNVALLWFPGLHRIASIQKADACAKQVAAFIDVAPRPGFLAKASVRIRRTFMGPPLCNFVLESSVFHHI